MLLRNFNVFLIYILIFLIYEVYNIVFDWLCINGYFLFIGIFFGFFLIIL